MSLRADHELREQCHLPPEPAWVARAREWVRKTLPAWDLAEHIDVAELIVSELVTNAIRHGHGPIDLHLSYLAGDLWIEVADEAVALPQRRTASPDATSGRGLELVDVLLASHTGVRGVASRPASRGKTVYVALALPRA